MSDGDDEYSADIARIRRRLRRLRQFVDDPDLREEIHDWIQSTHELVDADSVAGYVSARLSGLLADYPMYMSTDTDEASEAFPEECADCPHYGSACPVLRGPVEPAFRERKLAEATTEEEQRQVLERQALDTDCIRIPEFLEEWETEYRDFVATGEELLHRAEENVNRDLDQRGEASEAVADGGEP